jgi:type III secretory pathway component EscT
MAAPLNFSWSWSWSWSWLLRPWLVLIALLLGLPFGALPLRLLVASAATLLLAPALLVPAAALPGNGDGAALLSLMGREALVGAALGLVLSVPLAAARATGEILDQMMRGEAEGGGWVEDTAGVRALYTAVAALLFVQLGGPEAALRALARSYALVPIGALPPSGSPELAPIVLALPGRLFAAALLLAAHPVLVLLCAQVLCAFCLRAAGATAAQGAAVTRLAAAGATALGLAGALPVLSRLIARLPWELGAVLG